MGNFKSFLLKYKNIDRLTLSIQLVLVRGLKQIFKILQKMIKFSKIERVRNLGVKYKVLQDKENDLALLEAIFLSDFGSIKEFAET